MELHRHAHGDDRAQPPDRAKAHVPTGWRERIGNAIGRLWAPAIAMISRARHARMFHPEGTTFAGRIEPVIGGAFDVLAQRFDGRVLVRCSQALWRDESERFDVLGIALRIRPGAGADLDHQARPTDQDLLFATIRSPWTMLLAPFTTNAHDFLRNTYWAVSPFAAPPVGRVELRLVPIDPIAARGNRLARLRRAVESGRAAWSLEARETRTPGWHRLARVTFSSETRLHQAALRFDPFRSGLDIEPVGLVHAIRRAAYAASQRGRSSS